MYAVLLNKAHEEKRERGGILQCRQNVVGWWCRQKGRKNMQWEIKYDDGTRDRISAEKYDARTGAFSDSAKNVVATVNTDKVKSIKTVEPKKASA
jgi:hypothetical protein